MGQIRDRLTKLVAQPSLVRITRDFPGDPLNNGFVLGIGRELVLLHQFHDFSPEGYVALPVADIERTRSGEHERFWGGMFRAEGLLDRVGIPYEVSLDTFRSLLTALQKRGQHVIIQCEDRTSADDDDFSIGRVVSLEHDSVSILNFDPECRWDDVPCSIDYADITQVEFDTPYINTMSKYLRGSKPSIKLWTN